MAITGRGDKIVLEELADVLVRAIAGVGSMRLLHNLLHNLRKVAPDSLAFCFLPSNGPVGIFCEKFGLRVEQLAIRLASELVLSAVKTLSGSLKNVVGAHRLTLSLWHGVLGRQFESSVFDFDWRPDMHSSLYRRFCRKGSQSTRFTNLSGSYPGHLAKLNLLRWTSMGFSLASITL